MSLSQSYFLINNHTKYMARMAQNKVPATNLCIGLTKKTFRFKQEPITFKRFSIFILISEIELKQGFRRLPGLQVIFNKHFLIKFKSKSIVSGTDTQILRILQIFWGKRLKRMLSLCYFTYSTALLHLVL